MRFPRLWTWVAGGLICLAGAPLAWGQATGDAGVAAQPVAPVDRPNQIALRDLGLRLGMDLRAEANNQVVVAAVHPDSRAAALGVREGDVLMSVDRQAVTGQTSVVNIIAASNPEKKVAMVFNRDGEIKTVTTAYPDRVERIVAPATPATATPAAAGVSFFGLTASQDAQGRVIVTAVTPGSAAALAGVSPDDVLLRVNDIPVTSLPRFATDALALVRGSAAGDRVRIDALRDGSDQTFALILRESDFAVTPAAAVVTPAPVVVTPAPVAVTPVPATVAPAPGTVVAQAPAALPRAPAATIDDTPVRATDAPPAPRTPAPRTPAAAEGDPNSRVIFCMVVRRLASGSIVVTEVMEGSPADVAGIRAGDSLVSVGGERLDSLEELAQIIGRQLEGDTVEFGVVRADRLGSVQVKMLPCEYKPAAGAAPAAAAEPGGADQLSAEVRRLQTRVGELEEALRSLQAQVEELRR